MDYEAALNKQKDDQPNAAPPIKRDPMDPAPLIKLFDDFMSMADAMEAEVRDLVVDSDQAQADANEKMGQVRQLKNRIEKQRKDVIAPYNSVVGAINKPCKKLQDKLDGIFRHVQNAIRPYMIEKDRQRREAEAAAAAEAKRQQEEYERQLREAEQKRLESGNDQEVPDPVPPVTVVHDVPKETKISTDSGSSKLETVKKVRLVDIRQISDACIKARLEHIEKAVMPWANNMLKAGIENLPGFEVYEEQEVKTHAAKF